MFSELFVLVLRLHSRWLLQISLPVARHMKWMTRGWELEWIAALPKLTGSSIKTMAKVIEFYVPKRFQKAFVGADQAQAGKVIEFCSRAKAPASIPPSGGVLAWLLSGTVSSPAAGSE